MPESVTPSPRFPIVTLLAAFLALGLFVAATAAVRQWKPGPTHPTAPTQTTPPEAAP